MQWYEELPPILSNLEEACPEFLHRVRVIMKWRFQNIRIILHRPLLLTTAVQRTPWSALTPEQRAAVTKCRALASETIEDISQECMPDLISGSNAVWFCFQASLVPLVSLFTDASVPEEMEKWKSSLETALQFLNSIKEWSIAAKRSADVLAQLCIAYKTPPSSMSTPQVGLPSGPAHYQRQSQSETSESSDALDTLSILSPHSSYEQTRNPFYYSPATPIWANVNDPTVMNNFWDGIMWDNGLPDMLEAPFDPGNEYGFVATTQDPGSANSCWIQGS